jgi:undecaprenyl phosphate-alpha-L-ara4N flippase subunit ArnE
MGQHLITATFILASMGFTVAGNLILKTGTGKQGIGTVWPLTVLNGEIVIAAAAFMLAFFSYAMVLRRLPLSLAQAIVSLQFVLVILAANVVLNEQVGLLRWAGIVLMALGLAVVGISPSSSPAATAVERSE